MMLISGKATMISVISGELHWLTFLLSPTVHAIRTSWHVRTHVIRYQHSTSLWCGRGAITSKYFYEGDATDKAMKIQIIKMDEFRRVLCRAFVAFRGWHRRGYLQWRCQFNLTGQDAAMQSEHESSPIGGDVRNATVRDQMSLIVVPLWKLRRKNL